MLTLLINETKPLAGLFASTTGGIGSVPDISVADDGQAVSVQTFTRTAGVITDSFVAGDVLHIGIGDGVNAPVCYIALASASPATGTMAVNTVGMVALFAATSANQLTLNVGVVRTRGAYTNTIFSAPIVIHRSVIDPDTAVPTPSVLGTGVAAALLVAINTALGFVRLDSSARLPAVDGSQLTNVPNELPSQTGNSGKYLTTNGTATSWGAVSSVSDGDKGDITVSNTGATWTIDNDTVTLAKLAHMPTARVVGRTTAGTGTPELLTISGTGSVAMTTSPTFVTPDLGTPSALVGTNISGTAANLTAGLVTSIGNLTGDVTSSNRATTLATVNANVGSFTNAILTVNAKGLVTAASSGTSAVTSITGTANEITVTGTTTPTLSLPSALTFTGKTVTGGTFASPAFTTPISVEYRGTDDGGTHGYLVMNSGSGIASNGGVINVSGGSTNFRVGGNIYTYGATRAGGNISTFDGGGSIITNAVPGNSGTLSANISASKTLTLLSTNDYTLTADTTGTVVVQGGALGTPASGVGTNLTGTAASLTAGNATKWTTGRTIALTGDVTYTSGALDGSGNVTGTATLANIPAISGANLTGTAASLTAGNVTTIPALSGAITNTGNATVLGSFTMAQLSTAVSDGDPAYVGAANTFTAANTFSLAPGASTSAISTTGALYAAGTGTTNFPHFLIQPTAATASSIWSTAGTAIGVNLASASPDFIRCFVNGTGAGGITGGNFRVSGAGNMTITGAQYIQASSDFSTFKYAVGTNSVSVISGWQVLWAASSSQAEGTKDLSIGRNAAGILQIGNGAANASGSLTCTNGTFAGTLSVTGNTTLGTGTAIKNIRHGVSGAMVAGVVTVTDTGCTANTRYFFTQFTQGTVTSPSSYWASTRTASTSFVITSNQLTETGTVHWTAIEP